MVRNLTILGLLAFFATGARADTLHMTNGDVLNGDVTAVTKSHVTMESETLGRLELKRENVRSIHLGDTPVPVQPAATPPSAPGASAPAAPAPTADAALQQLLGRSVKGPNGGGATPEDVLKQLRSSGVDPGTMKQLTGQFPLLADPKAGGYFNQMLGGLVSGDKGLQDLRRDAVRARDELQSLKEELGAPGGSLDGYLSILNGFIDEVPGPKEEGDKAMKKGGDDS